jgi:hypothetical protein
MARGLAPTPDALAQALAHFKSTLPADKPYPQFLEAIGVDDASFQREFAQNMAVSALLKNVDESVPLVTDDEAKKIFEQDKAALGDARTVKLRQILVAVPPGAAPAAVADLEARAKALHARVAGKNANTFAAVAKEASDDARSKPRGGDLGDVAIHDLLPTIAEQAFALKAGEVSPPVQSERGFHILRSEGVTVGKERTFDDLKTKIIDRETRRRKAQALEGLVRGVIEKAKIERLHIPEPPPLPTTPMGAVSPDGMPPPAALPPGGGPPPVGPPAGAPGGHGAPTDGMPGHPTMPPGEHGALPPPTKDNVLPGMRNPHGGQAPLRLGEPTGGEPLKLPNQ